MQFDGKIDFNDLSNVNYLGDDMLMFYRTGIEEITRFNQVALFNATLITVGVTAQNTNPAYTNNYNVFVKVYKNGTQVTGLPAFNINSAVTPVAQSQAVSINDGDRISASVLRDTATTNVSDGPQNGYITATITLR